MKYNNREPYKLHKIKPFWLEWTNKHLNLKPLFVNGKHEPAYFRTIHAMRVSCLRQPVSLLFHIYFDQYSLFIAGIAENSDLHTEKSYAHSPFA